MSDTESNIWKHKLIFKHNLDIPDSKVIKYFCWKGPNNVRKPNITMVCQKSPLVGVTTTSSVQSWDCGLCNNTHNTL